MTTSKKKWIISVIGIIIVIFLCRWYGQYSNEQAEIERQKQERQILADYNKGIEELKQFKYDKAQLTLSEFGKGKYNNDERYWDAQVLYYYACAYTTKDNMKLYKEQAYQTAQDMYLNQIPDNYNGHFAKEIGWLKKDVKETLSAYKEGHELAKKNRAKNIYVGDPDVKVTQVFGEPIKKNTTVVGNTTREQWVYGNGHYVYIENGLVTGWQNTQ